MANNSPTIVAASLSDDQLKISIDSLVTHVDEAMKKMVQSTNNAVGEMEAKLKSLGNLKIDSNGTADGGASKRAKAQNAEAAAVKESTQAYKEKTMTLDQQASTINTAVQSEKKYTDEILRQAAAIRSSKEWQERGHVVIGDVNYYDKERANVSKRDKQLLLSLEEQIVQAQQKEAQEALVAAEAKRQQAQAAKEAAQAAKEAAQASKEAAQASKGVSSYDLGIDPNVSAGRQRQIELTRKASQGTEYLRQQVASLLEVEEKEVKSVNMTTASYSELSQHLKQLQSAYNKLGADRIKKGEGVDIANEIQRTQRAMQKLQQTMSRPVSLKDAMGLSEKTLDDIAYKMRQLASYRSELNIETQTKEIDQVNRKYAELQKKMNDIMQKNTDMIASNTTLGRSWNYMKNRLAFYFTVGAGTQFIKNLIEVRSQYEMNERALGILIDSAERGTQIFNELSQMALVSPYTLIELSSAAKQLTAYDVAAKDVVDTTRRLADMAAAVGIPIGRLTYALGQIKAYGYLNSRDARMFANAGIPLVKQLSDYYTELEGRLVSTADVYDRIKKKAIDYNEVMEVINKMTDEGGKFFDFQAKMADTLKVRLANLTLAWNNMLNDMGKEFQGVLTWGIGALREMFLHWKQLDSLIKNAAWALGIRTALMFIAYSALKVGVALGVTNKQMALSSVFGTSLAGVLKTVALSMKAIVTSPLTWWSLLAIAAVEATQALFGVNEAQKALNESIRNGAKDNYNNISKFLEQYKELRESLYKTERVDLPEKYRSIDGKEYNKQKEVTTVVDIDKMEATKAWEAVREQIELTVVSSDKYIGNLLSISNMSERVRQGFNLLDDIQVVNSALKELDDDTIKVSKDFSAWWNLGLAPEGLIENLKDYQETLNDIIAEYGTLESFRENTFLGGKGSDDLDDYETALERFRNDLQETTDSILNFIELKGWSGDESKINQVFEQITQKLVLDNQLDPQKAFTLQIEVEEARSKAAKEALQQRINDEKAAYKISHDESVRQALNADIERFNSWSESNGRSKVEWERFTKWLKEQHISETTAMFRNMDAEDIKSLNFQEGKHAEWVTRMVTQYAKEHKMSYDEAFKYLRSWVRSANQWSIFIPLIISTEDKKSVYDQLGEYDKAIDDADAQIERLTKRINELNAKKKKSKEETEELGRAEQELADAQKAKADAEAKGGHGKKEKKDEKAANKAASKAESELAKALKEELSTIDKVRSIYKDLTKEGMSHANAVERATRGWGETANAINRVLQKNGLQKLDLSKFAGIENPRELVNMLQSQLNTLLKRGAKPAEIKELQTKVNTLEVDADKYDLTKITKGLNNELGKLKDEYELAVELDANPELGNMFADMFGIDTSDFPKTIDEYMSRAQQEFDKIRKKRNFSAPLNIFKAGDKEWEEWGRQVGLVVDELDENGNVIDKNTDALDKITPKFKEAQGVAKKWAQDTIKATQELEYKLGDLAKKVEIEEAKLAVLEDSAANETNAAQKRLLELHVQEQKEAIEKLKMESVKLLPFYEDLFGDMYNVSVGRLKEIAKVAKEVMTPRQGDSGVGYTQRTDSKGNIVYDIFAKDKKGEIKKTTVSLEEYIKINKQIDSVQQKIAESSPWEKIKDSFSKKKGGGLKNFASGMETIGSEMQKVANITKEIGGFAEALGADESTVETINDIATSIGGVATAAQGIGQIASGDYIGGAVSVASGLFSAISSWFDNSDKKIVAKIKDSEREVKRLENSYKNLEYAIEQAYGMAEYGARRAAVANRQLQLVELQRQLRLEQSRDSKHRDEDRILELKGQIVDLRNEISQSVDDITNDLLGISSIGDAAEQLVSSMIEAFKQGEDYMLQYDESFEKMIDNMIMKAIVSRVVGDRIEQMWNQVKAVAEQRGAGDQKRIEELTKKLSDAQDKAMNAQSSYEQSLNGGWAQFITAERKKRLDAANKELERIKAQLAQAEKDYAKAIEPRKEDIESMRDMAAGWREDVKNEFEYWMGAFGIGFGEGADNKQLSSLQQGIQSVTEETAGALEAITNGISQQCYLQSDLLTQIRDAVVGMDIDIQTATQAQMLLQLQQSFQVQQSIQSILEGVLVPSGRAFSVELIS